ncbi:MAG TPA: hypothetical protein PK867_08050, partial [Pirellulales bacterium]|nr:hypothetical protein [Pirellulales bacterium]
MRSIPQTMIWELWRHGRWSLIAAALGAIAMPAFFFAVLRQEGVVDFRDSSQITMHMALLLMNLAMFIAAGFGAQEPPSRFYALPVTTASLVAWRMFPVMTVTALLSAMSSAVLNAAFGVGWPILGPALFSAVLVAAVQSAIWSTDKSGWEVPVMALVVGCAGVWFKSCYGAITSPPSFFWTEVTAVEIATLAAFAALAYCVAVNGVSRARRGDTLPGLGIVSWLDRLFDRAPASGESFRSVAHAQSWFEWRQKGRLMPAITIFGIIAGCCIWLISSRDPTTLYEGILAGGGMLSVAGLLGGLLLGNCGSSDADLSMGQFLATRPMASTEMARTILKTGVKGLLLAWIIWLAAFLTISLSLRAVEAAPRPLLPRGIEWWYFPASL